MAGPRKVDNTRLTNCVIEAEANGGLASQGDLWEKVAELYNAAVPKDMKKVAPSLVRGKVLDELKLTIKTVSGRAKAASVDLKVLQECIKEAESKGVLRNWSDLFARVAGIYNKRTSQSCSGATLQNLTIKNGLEVETPKGKKGGFQSGNRGVRTKKADRFAGNPAIVASFDAMRKMIPLDMVERFGPLVDQIEQGSRSAGVKLHCLDCSGWNTAEIKHCCIPSCGLWPFRPYQGNESVESGDVRDEEVEVEVEELEAVA